MNRWWRVEYKHDVCMFYDIEKNPYQYITAPVGEEPDWIKERVALLRLSGTSIDNVGNVLSKHIYFLPY